jgi:hypothetical protein
MKFKEHVVLFSVDHPILITGIMLLVTLLFAALVPVVGIKVDTDPENMLSEDEAVRVFHRMTKKEFVLHDVVVLGIVNEEDPDGVFNPQSLQKVQALTDWALLLASDYPKLTLAVENLLLAAKLEKEAEFLELAASVTGLSADSPEFLKNVKTLTDSVRSRAAKDPKVSRLVDAVTQEAEHLAAEGAKGEPWVMQQDLISPSGVDNIQQGAAGELVFSYLMEKVPQTREEARKIRDAARGHPLLYGTLLSEDGNALCIYIPLSSKDRAYKVAEEMRRKIDTFEGPEKYYITGLPVAEDQFGIEMFIQMAVSAPVAMLAIFILMLLFFRKLVLIISPMIIAMVSVISTMGLMISTGYTVHIMSSMIPIFLMPIAVVDSVHILSEFFDRYPATRDRRTTSLHVIGELFTPMLYTSLTSATGFASLALTPIPPVQAFGVFVAFGIMIAWIWTILFIPAYVMLIPERMLENFGMAKGKENHETLLSRILFRLGRFTYKKSGVALILAGTVLAAVVAGIGISRIRVNDNPVKWFSEEHEIRVADHVLNEHFGGTYEAYLILDHKIPGNAEEQISRSADAFETLVDRIAKAEAPAENEDAAVRKAFGDAAALLKSSIQKTRDNAASLPEYTRTLKQTIEKQMYETEDADVADALDIFWEEGLEETFQEGEIFKRPKVLRYVEKLQEALRKTGIVGKSNSVVDLIKKIHQELKGGAASHAVIPDDKNDEARGRRMVADCLMQVQNSHDPDDLWHLVNSDYTTANLWLQLKSGDNKDMEEVIRAVDRFFEENPPAATENAGVDLSHKWAGLTYLNVAWQDKMVKGMLQSFMGSFLVVFLLMALLFRSLLWGLLSMVPLTVTIGIIYGTIGLIGKDYDMPVAVLSALTLGIAVDFAIHFLERTRAAVAKYGSWEKAVGPMFGEPARAITRNVVVIAVGFTPLLLAPLVPYKTVGVFLASIMAISGLATLFILPAAVRLLQKLLFKVK